MKDREGTVASAPKSSTTPSIVLASSSPRRRELLGLLRVPYQVITPDIEEVPRPHESPRDYVLRNATEKGERVLESVRSTKHSFPYGAIVISADTIVVLDDQILEKPLDEAHALRMLEHLSGRTHTVYSGVSLSSFGTSSDQMVQFVAQTQVRLKALTIKEMKAYIRTGEPFDKAGGYAAQGIGSYMVEHNERSYSNVVGLPISEVVKVLTDTFSYPFWEGDEVEG